MLLHANARRTERRSRPTHASSNAPSASAAARRRQSTKNCGYNPPTATIGSNTSAATHSRSLDGTVIAAREPRGGCGRELRRCARLPVPTRDEAAGDARSQATVTARISSGLTKSRPESAAQARAARSSACVARGPAPTRMASSLRVRRTTCTAYSMSGIADQSMASSARRKLGEVGFEETRGNFAAAAARIPAPRFVQTAARQRKFVVAFGPAHR